MSTTALERIPPQDLDAEGSVLSAVLMHPPALDELANLLQPDHFYADANRRIYEAALALAAENKPVDMVNVAGWLKDRDRLAAVGGSPYLIQLVDAIPAVANVLVHARRIVDKARLRAVISAASRIYTTAFAQTDVAGFCGEAEAMLLAATEDTTRAESMHSMQVIMAECVHKLGDAMKQKPIEGFRTGFPLFDASMGGIKRKRIYTVAGRPGMGKTAWLTAAVRHIAGSTDGTTTAASNGSTVATAGVGVVVFSKEMDREQVGGRLLAQEASVETRRVDLKRLTIGEFERVVTAANNLSKLPILIDDATGLTITQIRSAVRRAKRKLDGVRLGVVAIDHIGLISRADFRGDASNDHAFLSYVMKQCMALAKDEDIAVIVLSQLNRDVEKRPNKRPMLSDLRASGSIEEDSFGIAFLYREDQYRKRDEIKDNRGELIVAKARGGVLRTIDLDWEPRTTTYSESAANEHDEFAGDFDDWRDNL